MNVRIRIDFCVRGGTEFGNLSSIGFVREEKKLHVCVLASQMPERCCEIRRDGLVRVVRTSIGVAPRDGIVKFPFFLLSGYEVHAGHKLWFWFRGNGAEFSR